MKRHKWDKRFCEAIQRKNRLRTEIGKVVKRRLGYSQLQDRQKCQIRKVVLNVATIAFGKEHRAQGLLDTLAVCKGKGKVNFG